MKRAALAALAFLAGMFVARRWHPKVMRLSSETLADLARRFDTAGLGEVNAGDAHPYAVSSMTVLPQDRAGADPRFRRAR